MATSKQKKTKAKKRGERAKPERPPTEGGSWVMAAGRISRWLRERSAVRCGRTGEKESPQVPSKEMVLRGKVSRAPPRWGVAGEGGKKYLCAEPERPSSRGWQLGEGSKGREVKHVEGRTEWPAPAPGEGVSVGYYWKDGLARKSGVGADRVSCPVSTLPPMSDQAARRYFEITNKGG